MRYLFIPTLLLLTVSLPVGLELEDGSFATEAEIGPLTLADVMAIEAEIAQVPTDYTEAEWRGVVRTARAIRRIGKIEGPFDGKFLASLHEDDASALIEATKEVRAREARFREGRSRPAGSPVPGGAGDGVEPGGDPGAA